MNISHLGDYFSSGWIFSIWVNVSHLGEYFASLPATHAGKKGQLAAVTIYPKKPAVCWFYFDNYISRNYHTSVSYDLYKFPLQKQSMPVAVFTNVAFANIPHAIWQNNEKKPAGIIGHVSKNYQSQKLIFLGKQYVTLKLLVTNNEWKFQKPQKGRRLFTCKFKKHHSFPGIPKTRGVSV